MRSLDLNCDSLSTISESAIEHMSAFQRMVAKASDNHDVRNIFWCGFGVMGTRRYAGLYNWCLLFTSPCYHNDLNHSGLQVPCTITVPRTSHDLQCSGSVHTQCLCPRYVITLKKWTSPNHFNVFAHEYPFMAPTATSVQQNTEAAPAHASSSEYHTPTPDYT